MGGSLQLRGMGLRHIAEPIEIDRRRGLVLGEASRRIPRGFDEDDIAHQAGLSGVGAAIGLGQRGRDRTRMLEQGGRHRSGLDHIVHFPGIAAH